MVGISSSAKIGVQNKTLIINKNKAIITTKKILFFSLFLLVSTWPSFLKWFFLNFNRL